MREQNEPLARGSYEAYSRGDTAKLPGIIDPGLEWTYLDPSLADPGLQTCHGREQLQSALQGKPNAARGQKQRRSQLAVTRSWSSSIRPGIHRRRVRQADDRNFLVLTLRQGRVIAMRACRDRAEARDFARLS